jgi:hypothetical protein
MTIVKSSEISKAGKHPSRRHNQRERKLLETSNQFTPAASADWDSAPVSVDGAVNELASKVRAMECVVATYDFAVQGGAQGAKALGVTLPNKFVVVSVVAHVITAITDGAGASPTLQLLAATDNISSLSPVIVEADSAGSCRIQSALPIVTVAGPAVSVEVPPIITTGARALNATISTADLTAGKVRFFIFGFQSI